MYIECDGDCCWFVVDGCMFEQLWLILKEFWQENGFLLKIDVLLMGIMVIDWVENCVNILDDWFCCMIGWVIDFVYLLGMCDCFCMFVNCMLDGNIDILIMYSVMEEMMVGLQGGMLLCWEECLCNLVFEVVFLLKLMQKFGLIDVQVKQLLIDVCFVMVLVQVSDMSGGVVML